MTGQGEPIVRCSKCGGTNIETIAWVDPNTHQLADYPEGTTSIEDNWCHDCDDHTRFTYDGEPDDEEDE